MSTSLPAPASWRPPQLSRNEAQAHTTIAQRALGMPLQCGGTRWRASLRPVIEAPWPTLAGDSLVPIEWAGAQLQLQLPRTATEQLLSALLGGAALPPLAEEMQAAALAAALDDLLASLERLGRGAPQLMPLVSGQPPAVLPHAFALQLDALEGSQAIAGLLRSDSLGLLLMAGLASALPPRDGPLAGAALALALYLDIGYATLSVEELQQLGPGDVVPMAHSFVSAERVLWLQAPGAGGLHVQLPAAPMQAQAGAHETALDGADDAAQAAPVPAAAPFLTVVQSWSHAMPALDPPLSEAASFDAIPVRLSFDLGEISLTLAELRALQPGQAIRLGHPVANAVRIRANGALIGEGELVEIDGLLGVSVRQLFAGATAYTA
ncbi:type III secretion system cytoplasmic ring protein SctQ [Pantoea sp. 18069]|uniref:type III secretion system cytoplasmic ring protein SctQ n=1 Tax=Pantoea sp. 18069 TaxID=2681415 RepID=UPI0013573FF3|nr:type III secretion system cytoplasmic ring protein SctQ [Pantoea sp. 18069]